jgi:hypothetical protein
MNIESSGHENSQLVQAGLAGHEGLAGISGPAGPAGLAVPQAGATATVDRKRIKPPKLYRIGEVVDYSGMSRQTIHNYTIMGLLHESKWTSGGHRLYDESVFERLDLIADLKLQDKSLEDIREVFVKQDGVQG